MRKTKPKGRQREKILTGQSIDAMSDAERRKLVAELDAETPEQRLFRARPLTAEQRATWRNIKHRMGRRGEKRETTVAEFMALPDAEKNRIVAEIETQTPAEHLANSRPLNAAERARWKAFKRNAEKKRRGTAAGEEAK